MRRRARSRDQRGVKHTPAAFTKRRRLKIGLEPSRSARSEAATRVARYRFERSFRRFRRARSTQNARPNLVVVVEANDAAARAQQVQIAWRTYKVTRASSTGFVTSVWMLP